MTLLHSFIFVATFILPLGDSETSSTQQPPPKVIEVPNPMTLSNNWWAYFKDDTDNQKVKTDKFLSMLEELQSQLSPEEIEAASPYLTKILIQLEVYKNLEVDNFAPPVAYPFHDSYTIEQISTLAEELFRTKAALSQDKKEHFRLTQQRENIERHLDRQSVEYIKLSKPSQEKLILGLDIIGTRFTVAIKDKLIKSITSKIQFLSDKTAILMKELNHAFDHLDEKAINPAEIQAHINQQESELVVRQNETLRAELQALSHFGTSDAEQIAGMVLNQRAVDSLLDDAIISSDISTLKLVLLLSQYKDHLGEKEVGKFLDQIREIKHSLDELRDASVEWEQTTVEDGDIQNELLIQENPELAKKYEQHYQIKQSSLEKIKVLKNRLFFASLLADSLETRFQSQQSTWSCCWYGLEDYYYMGIDKYQSVINYRLFKVNELPITVGAVLWALFAFICILVASSLFRMGLRMFSGRFKSINESNLYVLDRMIFYTSMLIAVFFFLYALGFDTTNILLILGGLSVGIGFGLQNIVNNFVCSIIILFHRKIKIGDLLKLPNGEWGKVSDINVQNTVLHTWDGTDLVVPNSNLLSEKYENWTLDDYYKRLHIPFGVAYGSDKDTVVKAVLEAADRVPCTIKNHRKVADPAVWLTEFYDSSLGFELIVWVNLGVHSSIGSYTAAYKWEIESSLAQYGIIIPFPQRDLHIKEIPTKA